MMLAKLTKALILSLALCAGIAANAQEDPNFDRRWQSLLAGGYEPLTIPPEWYDPVAVVDGLEMPFAKSTAKDAGISPTALASAAAWAESQNSTALIVARGGKIVFERYWQGTGRDTRFNPQSMSKTVMAMLVGVAIERGEIASVNDPISRYITEWAGEDRGQITIAQMLQMAAGLEQGDNGFGYAVTPENPIVRHSLGSDYTKLLLRLKLVGKPGEKFDYNNQVNQLVGLALERASGQEYETLLSQRLWKPLGLRSAAIPLDREGGLVITSCCIMSRPIDWVRIGQLFNSGGAHQGEEIIPSAWLDAMQEPSPAYAGYGYQLWVHDQTIGGERPPRVPLVPWQSERFASERVLIFHGHGGQRVYAMPDKDLVIVRAARQWPDAWDDALLPNVIWRGTELGDYE